jgi:hypothetical protein
MKQVLSAIERQIRIEEGRLQQREIKLANKDQILFNEPLPNSNQAYLDELKSVLPLLKYLSEPLRDWTEKVDGTIYVPDELDPLVNKIGMQLRFHTISGKGEAETICSILYNAQKFFHEFRAVTATSK